MTALRRKPARQLEHMEQVALIQWAGTQWFNFHRQDGGSERMNLKPLVEASLNGATLGGDAKLRAIQMAKLKKAGMRKGASDITVHVPVFENGKLKYPYGKIEMKKRMDQFGTINEARKAVSEDQEIYLLLHRKLGAYTGVAYGWEHAAWHICQMLGLSPNKRLGYGWQKVVPINER